MAHFRRGLVGFAAFVAAISVGAVTLAQEPPGTPASAATVHAREARVIFESSPEHLGIYRSSIGATSWVSVGRVSGVGADNTYQRVCVSPCGVSLPAGTDTYSITRVSEGETWPHSIGAITVPEGASTVRLKYRDRQAIRHVGTGFFVASAASAIYALVKLGGFAQCRRDDDCAAMQLRGMLWGGGVALGALIVGGVLVGVDDAVDVQVSPRKQAFDPQLPRARQLSLRGIF